jgi:hypothetical protein
MGAILGLGTYFIIIPAYNSADRVDDQIEEKRKQIDTALELQSREIYLDSIMEEVRERAGSVHEGFIGEITRTESTILVQELLAGANNGRGFTAQYGIKITDILPTTLFLQYFQPPNKPQYALRSLSTHFTRLDEEGNEYVEPPLNPEEIEATRMMIARFAAGNTADENEVSAKLNEFTESPLLLMQAATQMLKSTTLSAQERANLIEYVRPVVAVYDAEVGLIRAEFALRLTFDDYLDFLQYLHRDYSHRVEVKAARLFQHNDSSVINNTTFDESTGLADYEFVLNIYVVRPIDIPETDVPEDEDEDAGEEAEE